MQDYNFFDRLWDAVIVCGYLVGIIMLYLVFFGFILEFFIFIPVSQIGL